MKFKFLILLATYNRKKMVMDAIESVLSQDYENFELAIVDDNSKWTIPESVRDHEKVSAVLSGDTDEDKKGYGNSRHGYFMNLFMDQTDADITFMLCDDDILVPGYLSALNEYYNTHNVKCSYCHVRTFNPLNETAKEVGTRKNPFFTNIGGSVNPAGRIDASQVSWFISEDRFPEIATRNLDMAIYGKLHLKYGACQFNGIDGQYKAVWPGQLGKTKYGFES